MSEDTKQETEDNMEVKPVGGGKDTEPQAVPSEPEAAKETEAKDGKEIDEKSETAPLSAEVYREMEAKVEKAESKAAEHWDRLLRCRADFDNFKKRTARERIQDIKYANEALLESLVPALDNLDMAMAAMNNAGPSSVDSLKQGVHMVFKQLKDAIQELGMEEINAAGQMFNPAWHEAVEQRESGEVPEGQVIEQIRKGYKLKDRLIRPAKVIVAKPAAVDSADSTASNTAAEARAQD